MPDIKSTYTANIRYLKQGAGKVVVLLHGFPESSAIWRYIVPQLSERYTVIAPDMPGVGASTFAKVSIDEMAAIVKEILDAESIKEAIIVGHSMGGYVAISFAQQFPEYVAGLTMLHSLPYADSEDKIANRRKAIQLINNGGKDAFVRAFVPNLFPEYYRKENPTVIEAQINAARTVSEQALVSFYEAMIARSDRSTTLIHATYPIQWIMGKDDALMDYMNILQYCYAANVNFVHVLDNCGHMAMLEMPQLLLHHLLQFATYTYNA